MITTRYNLLLGLICFASYSVMAQDIDLYDAIGIALEKNYDVRTSVFAYEIDQNNAEVGNAGFMPYVYLNGQGSYTSQDTELNFASPEQPPISADGATSIAYGASANLEYLVFNGGRRLHIYRQLQTLSEDGRLRERLAMESTALSISSIFLETIRLNELRLIDQQSIDLSLERLFRAEENYKYGNTTKLQLLNAEVDLRTDSISLANSTLEYGNSLRRLNLNLGLPADTILNIDSTFTFMTLLNRDELLESALNKNTIYLRARNAVNTANETSKAAKGDLWPIISANAAYQYNYSDFEANFIDNQENLGWNAGLTLRLNIFDGNRIQRNIRNAEIQENIAKVEEERNRNEVVQLVNNAYDTYLTNINLLEISRRNLDLAQSNYDRSLESFSTGQITGVELRTAQLNLNESLNGISRQRVITKIAEMALLFEAGMLLE